MPALFPGGYQGRLSSIQGCLACPRPQTSSWKENRNMKILAILLAVVGCEFNAHTCDDQYRLFGLSSVVRCRLSVAPVSTTDNRLLTTDGQPKSAIQNPKSPEPWYERVLRRINPSNFDYGAWLEERRVAFLEATVTNRYFWYSFWVTMGLIITILAYAKHRSDFHKFTWMSAG